MKTIIIKGADFSANALGKTVIPTSPLNWKFGVSKSDYPETIINVYNKLSSGKTTQGLVGTICNPSLTGLTVNAVKLIFSNEPFPGYEDEANLNIPSKDITFGIFYGKMNEVVPETPLVTFTISELDLSVQEKVIRIPETLIEANGYILVGFVNYDGETGVISSKNNVTSMPVLFAETNGTYTGRVVKNPDNSDVLAIGSMNTLIMDFSIINK